MRPSSLLLCLSLATPSAHAEWNQWRGARRDGVSPEKGLLQTWPKEGPKLAWQIKGLGRGMASTAHADGKIFTMGERQGAQQVIAFDAATQKELWATMVSQSGGEPRCTPTIAGGLVYALSDDGELLCCAAADGKEIWRKSYKTDFGDPPKPGWQFSESPLVDDGKVIVTPGHPDHFMVALDAKTGARVWALKATLEGDGHEGAGYTGAVVSQGGGVKQFVTMVGKGAIGVRAADGTLLWHYNPVANGTAVIPTPLVWDDYVFVSSGYQTGAALLKLVKDGRGVKAVEQYFLKHNEFQNHHGGMVRLGDHIYAGTGHNNGFPICLEWKTGKVVWNKDRGPGRESAAVISGDGQLYFRYQDATMALIAASPAGYRENGVFKLPFNDGPSWPHPALDKGRLYLRSQDVLMCFEVK
ncbi:MAG: PQQ-binding-like beta-propeller repeat protein [Verrucomicrobiales bacterium]